MNGKLIWHKLEMSSLSDTGEMYMHTVKLHIPFLLINNLSSIRDVLPAMRTAIQRQLQKAKLHYSEDDVIFYETYRADEVCYTVRCTSFETYEYRWWYYHRFENHNKYYDQLFGQIVTV